LKKTDLYCQRCNLEKDANAIYTVSLMLKYGEGDFIKSEEEWFKWANKAAALNHSSAMRYIGKEYFNTKSQIFANREKNKSFYEEGLRWLEKSANAGSGLAMESLGNAFSNGLGIEADKTISINYYKKAAERGALESIAILAIHYEMLGEIESSNYRKSAHYYRMATDMGIRLGAYRLGEFYYLGKGVRKNYVISYALTDLGDILEKTGRPALQSNIVAVMYKATTSYSYVKKEVRDLLSDKEYLLAKKLSKKWSQTGTTGEVFDPEDQLAKITGIPHSYILKGTGTGFFITADGYLLTAAHVIEKASKVDILANSARLPAKVIRVDSRNDLALLKVNGHFTALPLSNDRSINIGTDAFTIGFPNILQQGKAPKLTKGSISSKNGLRDDPSSYQISAAIQPGNSGGPLLDFHGNVLGLIQGKLDDVNTLLMTGTLPQNVNYALKTEYILPLLGNIPKESLAKPNDKNSFEECVDISEKAVCIVLVYD